MKIHFYRNYTSILNIFTKKQLNMNESMSIHGFINIFIVVMENAVFSLLNIFPLFFQKYIVNKIRTFKIIVNYERNITNL